MKAQYILKHIFPILLLMVLLTNCNFPTSKFSSKGVKLDKEMAETYNHVAGTYQSTGEIEDYSSAHEVQDKCEPGVKSYAGKNETLTFNDNRLLIDDEIGQRVYTYQNFGQFCREIDSGKVECIEQITSNGLTSDGYVLNVYPDKNTLDPCYVGVLTQTLIEKPEIAADLTEDSEASQSDDQPLNSEDNQTGNYSGEFSISNCQCGGVSIPLLEDSSRAVNNSFDLGLLSSQLLSPTGELVCNWQDEYQPENKVGMIRILLNLTRFDTLEEANELFLQLRQDIISKPANCEAEPDRCTVAVEDFSDSRLFYAFKNIYVGGQGELPSDHGAGMAEVIESSGEYYVLDLMITHPELPMSDNWVASTALAIETCVKNLVSQ